MTPRHSLATLADQAFAGFLRQFGMARTGSASDDTGEVVVYGNKTTAVRVYRDPRDRVLLLNLFRAREGESLVRWGVEERAADPNNGYDVLDLVSLRAPNHPLLASGSSSAADPAATTRTLKSYAEALPVIAQDVLQGDFKVFGALQRIEEQRRGSQSHS